MNMLLIAFTLAPVIADNDSDALAAAPLLLALSGFIFYAYIHSRYRNADKRHSHESETSAHLENLAHYDTFLQSRKGLRNATMQGANHLRIEGAQNVSGGSGFTKKLLKSVVPGNMLSDAGTSKKK